MVCRNPDDFFGNIIMSRVRLARNVSGYPFRIKDKNKAEEIIKKVKLALLRSDDFELYRMSELTDLKLSAMKEKHLISQNLIENTFSGAVLINRDNSVSIMINEEDHIREQSFKRGLHLREAFYELNKLDDQISRHIELSYDKKLGYITACPTNLGTGLRASVMMFLPALTESGKIMPLLKEVERLGLTIRGLYGEGSKAEGCIYQISNEVTLGVSEEEIISRVEETVFNICEAERDQGEKLYVNDELFTMDKASKSYGVLTNALLLSYSEFLSHIARVKIGAMYGMIGITDIDAIDDLIVNVRKASICEKYGKKLKPLNEQLFRAEIVANNLKKIKD